MMMFRARLESGIRTLLLVAVSLLCLPAVTLAEDEIRSADHQKYADDFWSFVSQRYPKWQTLDEFPAGVPAPEAGVAGKIYANEVAMKDPAKFDYGSILVVEYERDGKPYAASTLYRSRLDVNKKNDDWYEVFYLIDGTVAKTSGDNATFAHEGFVTKLVDGRLWVLAIDSPELTELLEGNGPEKHVTLPGSGPEKKTIKSDSRETALAYLMSKPGFVTFMEDGRAWVFAEGTDAATSFAEKGAPEKHVTVIGAGPMRTTLKAPDRETIDAFLGVTLEPTN
ncbi:hypothetical protein [Blastopirellula marina]|uniref:hypothetical protein n=1 Tax=Blastopirellula marina TaxID=124 RepID=UPI0018EE34A3|nr:hypothetical protein [Blastopirellula marina]